MISRRGFVQSLGLAGAAGLVRPSKLLADIRPGKVPSLQPLFRLPVEWYRGTVKRFQQHLAEQNLAGAIVSDVLNRNYLTGIFLTETERPNFLFGPASGEPFALIPGLDRDMAASWWLKDFQWYFDFPHAGEYNRVAWKAARADFLGDPHRRLRRRRLSRAVHRADGQSAEEDVGRAHGNDAEAG